MIGRLNHIAIAVPDLEEATKIYPDTLGAKVSEPVPLPEPTMLDSCPAPNLN